MPLNYQELDHAETRFGELVLRRRWVLSLGGAEVYEVKLGGDFLMSSLVNDSEVALAELGLGALVPPAENGPGWSVVVGGLGLGCTAATVLDDARVGELLVVEALPQVLGWHRQGLVPLGQRLTGDGRCRLVEADFFARAADPAAGLDPDRPGRRFDAILVDIDHSPDGLLHDSHGGFYTPEGLGRVAAQLDPGGVFALWSFEPPDKAFTARLAAVFASAEAHAVTYHNPLLDRDDTNAVYVARAAG